MRDLLKIYRKGFLVCTNGGKFLVCGLEIESGSLRNTEWFTIIHKNDLRYEIFLTSDLCIILVLYITTKLIRNIHNTKKV